MGAWTQEAEPTRGTAGAVTLVEGASFCVCTPGGDLGGVEPHGVFFRDTRILSRWDLTVDGQIPEPLAAMTAEAYRGIFLGRLTRRAGRTDSNLLVQRDRRVGNGLREDLLIRNTAGEPAACTVTVSVEADFADLFDVKDGQVRARGDRWSQAESERIVLDQHANGHHRGAVVVAPGGSVDAGSCVAHSAGTIRYEIVVPARGRWTASILVQPVVDGEGVEPFFPLEHPPDDTVPARRVQRWHETTPLATAGNEGLRRSSGAASRTWARCASSTPMTPPWSRSLRVRRGSWPSSVVTPC